MGTNVFLIRHPKRGWFTTHTWDTSLDKQRSIRWSKELSTHDQLMGDYGSISSNRIRTEFHSRLATYTPSDIYDLVEAEIFERPSFFSTELISHGTVSNVKKVFAQLVHCTMNATNIKDFDRNGYVTYPEPLYDDYASLVANMRKHGKLDKAEHGLVIHTSVWNTISTSVPHERYEAEILERLDCSKHDLVARFGNVLFFKDAATAMLYKLGSELPLLPLNLTKVAQAELVKLNKRLKTSYTLADLQNKG